ncbi:Protein tyrosine phosphatase, partial [Operophtera brumata]
MPLKKDLIVPSSARYGPNGGYPAKLKKVLIVTAPLWFNAPFQILRLFVREKLRERVHTVNAPQLSLHVPHASLPKQLGGQHQLDHNSKLDGVINEYVISNHIPPAKPQNGIIEHGAECDMTSDRAARLGDSSTDMHISGDPPYTCDPSPLSDRAARLGDSSTDIHISGDPPYTCDPSPLSDRAARLGDSSTDMHISGDPPYTCDPSPLRLPANVAKNRYKDVLCYDHSRVRLSQTDPEDPSTDYINANYGSLVIVMTTRVVERGHIKCGQYWPCSAGARDVHGGHAVACEAVEHDDDYTVTHLLLTDLRTEQTRSIWHGQYKRWPDYGVPGGGRATPLLRFLLLVRRAQQSALADVGDAWAGHSRGPPIVVHCSAGIGRTGTLHQATKVPRTFLTLDICASRLAAERVVDVRGTVERIRAQRAFSIQMPDQYVFCHHALIEYAVNTCALRLAAERVVDVRGTVERIRAQRAFSIQMPDQYVFCHHALIEYAVNTCASRIAAERVVDVRGTVERIRAQRAFSTQMPDQYVFCHHALIEYAVSMYTNARHLRVTPRGGARGR